MKELLCHFLKFVTGQSITAYGLWKSQNNRAAVGRKNTQKIADGFCLLTRSVGG